MQPHGIGNGNVNYSAFHDRYSSRMNRNPLRIRAGTGVLFADQSWSHDFGLINIALRGMVFNRLARHGFEITAERRYCIRRLKKKRSPDVPAFRMRSEKGGNAEAGGVC